MFRIFIVLVLIIGSSSAVLFTNAYLSFQQSKTNLIERDRMVLRDIKNQLVQSIVKNEATGKLMLPMGVEDVADNRHRLPSWFFTQELNPFGIKYIYCPFGQLTGTYTDTISVDGTTEYNVGLINSIETDNEDYVLYSDFSIAPNILGIIISNHDRSNAINCQELSVDNNLFYGANSLVEVIYADEILYNETLREDYYNISDSTTLNGNLSAIENRVNNRSILSLSGSLNVDNYSISGALGDRKTIKITSPTATTLNSTSTSTLTFENMNVYLENITVSNDVSIVLKNANLYVNNSTLSQITSVNSHLELKNTSINLLNQDWDITNSIINMDASGSWVLNESQIWLFNSKMNVINSTSSILLTNTSSAYYPINILMGSELSLDNVVLTLNETGTFSGLFNYDNNALINILASNISGDINLFSGAGDLVAYNTTLESLGVAIEGLLSSNVYLNNVIINANTGILDSGILTLSGFSNTITATNCIAGDLGTSKIISGAVDYDAVRAGSYVVSGGTVDLTDTTDTITVSIDIKDVFSDIVITCL